MNRNVAQSVRTEIFNGYEAALESFDLLVYAALLSYGLTIASSYTENDRIEEALYRTGEGIRFMVLGFFVIVVSGVWKLWV